MRRSRGEGTGPGPPLPPPPLKNHKNILSNTGPDPLKNRKATKPTFNVGPSSTSQRNAISMAFQRNAISMTFRWKANDGLLLVIFGLLTKKTTK